MASENLFTVAAIRKSPDGRVTEFVFNESQRIFELEPGAERVESAVDRVNKALRSKRPLKVDFEPRSNRIRRISEPSESEAKEFLGRVSKLEKPERPRAVDLAKIDPNTFNIVEQHLKIPVFAFCLKVVPNYAKAKEIFDYCAKQSCALPGPYEVNPCIPFQYVIDGCYARAHKMRWIITTKYKYCCEKVFSFANKGMDTLAVQATKWGGCCVTWWYHVAPLIRVKVGIGKFTFTKAMVIDPGMFDQPVNLSVWLSAQEKTACSPNAKVSMYSIQQGSAYSPANYAGTQFTTDDNYTATDATLNAYKNLHTCA